MAEPYVRLTSMPYAVPISEPAPLDENAAPALLISSGILMFFVVVTTAVRLYVRTKNRMLGWDDYTIGATALLAIARLGLQIVQGQHGNGRHRLYIAQDDYRQAIMYGWYAQLLLFLGVCLLKVSICLLLLRIKDEKRLRYLMYGVMAGLVVTNGGIVIILLAECRPVAAYWMGDGQCWDPKIRIYSIYFSIAYGIITDLLCSFLPLFVVWKVCIPLKMKLLVCVLMSLGLLATGFGIGRAVSLNLMTRDLTWVYCVTATWANLELFLGITTANLALSRSMYVYFFGDPEANLKSQSRTSFSRAAYMQQKLRCEKFDKPEVTIECGRRRPSMQQSDYSGPASPGIQKRTEFWLSVSEEDLRAKNSSEGSGSGESAHGG